MTDRRHTRRISVRNIPLGAGAPVAIQSMTNVKTADIDAVVDQINRLSHAGCDIVRCAIPDREAATALRTIRQRTTVPLVADIHFDYRLAIAAIEAGADKIRINPGNIGTRERVHAVVDAARMAHIPIRIGVNSGSLEKNILEKYHGPKPEALLESALGYIAMMESFNFNDIILSIKASSVTTTIAACRLLAEHTDVPQHIGITESGTTRTGTIRSSVGIGTLLAEGIGDTIRVSLCGDPVQEIYVAKEILKSLDLASGPVVVACPTCGRTEIDVAELAAQVETMVAGLTIPLTIAVMGCVVNGPGEAREADIGIAGGRHEGLIIVHGKILRKVPEKALLDEFSKELGKILSVRQDTNG